MKDSRSRHPRNSIIESTKLAGKLGVTAFGGPAAHIAMLRQEVVERRKWLSDAAFLDLLGVTNLIPGPNSTEMVMHVGHVRGGRRGMVLAGTAFILPAALITLVFAWLYVRYGTTPEAESILWGIKPVIIAVVGQAVWGLAKVAGRDAVGLVGVALVAAAYLSGLNELVLLFAGGLAIVSARRLRRGWKPRATLTIGWPLLVPSMLGLVQEAPNGVTYTHVRLFLTFLKIGSVLYGSGYVLLAFLRGDFVERLGWLTEQQLLDAVAVGQVTPGPVFTTATFVGYVAGGFPGAILATVAIFLPAFAFVGLTHPLIEGMNKRPILRELLDGVNVAALGLMAAVGLQLGREAIVDVWTAGLAVVSAALLIRWKVNATWLVALGAIAGLIRWQLG